MLFSSTERTFVSVGLQCLASEIRRRRIAFWSLLIGGTILLAACGGEDEVGATASAGKTGGGTGSDVSSAPTISGDPPRSAMQDSQYSFTPAASDPDGDPLTFTVQGLPSWATFNASTGRISGTPGPGDLGSYAKIRLRVSDGKSTLALATFAIDVVATSTGAATVSWMPPTEKIDGSPLLDLAGYRIYWGRTEHSYTQSVTLDNPGLTSYVVEQLTAGTWYFAATALDAAGMESRFSNVASKTIE
jgi:hypothetical protein